ncbi:MAG: GspH/FimT family pseudopilin [Pseudomonadales bacterium]
MRKKNKGFTLLELMIVLVIAGIAMGAAFPAFQGMITRNRIATQTNDLLLAINVARSEALRVSGIVSVQAIDGGDANSEFGEGYCVVVGNPGDCDGADEPGGADPRPFRVFPALVGQTRLDSVENVTSLQFNSLGALSGTAGATRAFDICHPDVAGRRIVITAIGRSKSHRPDDPVAAFQPDC